MKYNLMESKSILLIPEFVEKKSTSMANIKSKKTMISHQNSLKFRRDFVYTPSLRKQLPQTSNLIARSRKGSRKPLETSSLFQDNGTSPRSDCDTETIILKGNKKVIVSSQLSMLIVKLLSIYPSCPVIQDSVQANSSEIYKYLFNNDLKQIYSISEIIEPPILVIISCRNKLPDGILIGNKTREKSEEPVNKKYNTIDMYGSIINTKKSFKKKNHKAPLYIFKSNYSQIKIPRSFNPPDYNDYTEKINSLYQIFPSLQGKKVKEGAGGFKKPQLLFEKTRNCISPVDSLSKSPEKPIKKSVSATRNSFKETFHLDSICIKHSLIKEEFVNMLSDFTFLSDSQSKPLIKTLLKAYNVNFEIIQAIDPGLAYKKDINWEEFTKFYVIIVLNRGNYLDLTDFIIKYFKLSTGFSNSAHNLQRLKLNNEVFAEKIKKILDVLSKCAEDSASLKLDLSKLIQDSGVSLYDLRILVSLIVKSV